MALILFSAIVLVTILTFVLVIVFLYRAAKRKQQATFPEEGTMEFVVAGNDLRKIILNVSGHELDESVNVPGGKIVQIPTGSYKNYKWPMYFSPKRYLQEKWGFYWVSLFYPIRKIHRFYITKARVLAKDAEHAETPILQRVEYEEKPQLVSNLRFQFPRPFAIGGIETKDGFGVNILFQATICVVYPYIPVMLLGGKFFPLLEAAVSSAAIDYLAQKTYTEFRDQPKGKDSEFAKAIIAINRTLPGSPHGIEDGLGLAITSAWVEGFELVREDSDARKALKAKELQTQLGEAEVARSVLDMQAAENRAKGNAAEVRELVRSYERASFEVVRAISNQVCARHLSGPTSKITVLGGQAMTMIPIERGSTRPAKNQNEEGEGSTES